MQDAFSSKYKNALYSGVFENAVKKYRRKEKEGKEDDYKGLNIPTVIRPFVVEESATRAQRNLENLPGKVLEQAGLFRRYIQYLLQAEHGGAATPDLELMLNDISRTHKLDDRMREEILQDEEARSVSVTLFLVFSLIRITGFISRPSAFLILRVSSILKRCVLVPEPLSEALRELVDVAESTRSALAERDIIAARYREQQQVVEYENPEEHASGSGTYHLDTPRDSDTS